MLFYLHSATVECVYNICVYYHSILPPLNLLKFVSQYIIYF